MRRLPLCVPALVCLLGPAAFGAGLGDVLPGARPAAMGMAYTAVSDDPFGMFYNPAGLSRSGFTQMTGSAGRMLSPKGLVAFGAGAYSRPLPILPGSTIGAGYFSIKQAGTEAERNEMLFHFSHSVRLPQIRLERPLKYGANLKIRQAVPGDDKKKNKVGLGLDAGALFEPGGNWKTGLAVRNLESGVGLPTPELALGYVYTWKKRVDFVADLRIRRGLTEIAAGIEADLYQRLLKVRVGKGLALDTEKQIAFGLGVNFSPVFIDVGMNIPFNGLNHPGGAYQLGVTYKFGAPPFYGRFVGESARAAEDLRLEILDLEERKKTLDRTVEEARSENSGLEGQIEAREGRLRELENRIRQLEFDAEKKVYEKGHPQPKPAGVPRPVAKPAAAPAKPKVPAQSGFRHPKRHKVQAGDTLRKLSERYYGDPTLWETIYDANPDKIERGLPVEGTTLSIPVPRGR